MPGMSSIENEITSGNKIFVLYAESGEKGRRGRRREKERERSGARWKWHRDYHIRHSWRENSLVNHAWIFPSFHDFRYKFTIRDICFFFSITWWSLSFRCFLWLILSLSDTCLFNYSSLHMLYVWISFKRSWLNYVSQFSKSSKKYSSIL